MALFRSQDFCSNTSVMRNGLGKFSENGMMVFTFCGQTILKCSVCLGPLLTQKCLNNKENYFHFLPLLANNRIVLPVY